MEEKYQKIGKGWDYTTYQLSRLRVRKIKNTKYQLLWLLIRTLNIVPALRVLICGHLPNHISTSTMFVKELIEKEGKDSEVAKFFGNPEFFENDRYDQDKVFTIGECLNGRFVERRKKFLDWYIAAIHFMWRKGFSDTSFKFSKNYGIDTKREKIILIDFSNLTTDKTEVEKLLRKGFPLKTWVYRKMGNRELKRYYKHLVQTQLTPAKLKELWLK